MPVVSFEFAQSLSFDLFFTSGISYNLPRVCAHPIWEPNGITIANETSLGRLDFDIFVHVTNRLYVYSKFTNSVSVWLNGSLVDNHTILNLGMNQTSLFVTFDGEVIINYFNQHFSEIIRHSNNATNPMIIMRARGKCFGIFVDFYENVYCSITEYHQVLMRSFNDHPNKTQIIAGNGTAGSLDHLLSSPHGIFVTERLDLYVADCGNNRVQLFQKGILAGITVAGNGVGNRLNLSCPMNVVLDSNGHVYISDHGNHRIIRTRPDGDQCIVGCQGYSGSASNELFYPQTIWFDSYGNLFVADRFNHRIQKFNAPPINCCKFINEICIKVESDVFLYS